MQYLQLALLLEEAAKALRKANAALSKVPAPPPKPPAPMITASEIQLLKGYDALSIRARRCLTKHEIHHLSDVGKFTGEFLLLRTNGFGNCALAELRRFLAANQLHLKGDELGYIVPLG